MSEHPYITDLKFAQTTGVAVEIVLRNGVELLTGVKEVHPEHSLVTLWNPQTFGDKTTTRRLNIGDIVSLTVTDIKYRDAA